MILSILVLTLDSRVDYYNRLMAVLEPQVKNFSGVEIVTIKDNGEKTIGQKRNEAIDAAKGKYVCFVDDDDLISSDYVSKIYCAIHTRLLRDELPDCIGISLLHFNDGILGGLTYHNLDYRNWHEMHESVIGLMRYYRNPNHLNPIKRELALQCRYPEISHGEDRDFSNRVLKLLNTQVTIPEPIYYYLFRSKK